MRVATLNVQNLRLMSAEGVPYLHGAWDSDDPEREQSEPFDRRLTAELLAEVDADVVALQEVFDQDTLDYFNDAFLRPAGLTDYTERVCLPGNDGRGLDVAVVSCCKIDAVHSHAKATPGDLNLKVPEGVDPLQPVFRRDCLQVTLGALTLFVCHFKSNYPDPAVAWRTRRLEALAARRVIEQSFDAPEDALWLVLGDLNEPDGKTGEARAVAPLEAGFSVDLMARVPKEHRWTYFDVHSGAYHCPDALLASPALAQRWPEATPVIVRKGLGREVQKFAGPRFSSVGAHRPHASDHAVVYVDLDGL